VATLEIYDEFDRRGMPVTLSGTEVTVGRAHDNVLVLEDDKSVSNSHLVLKAVGNSWDVRDVGSMNGTILNGYRLTHEVILRDGDELEIGHTRLRYLNPETGHGPTTEMLDSPPPLTEKQRETLVFLCLPRLDGNPFTPPASTQAIAECMYITRPGAAMHLAELYRKFAIPEGPDRRAALANAAMYRRAITMEDLREAKRQREAAGD
jgi:hypothetical protein